MPSLTWDTHIAGEVSVGGQVGLAPPMDTGPWHQSVTLAATRNHHHQTTRPPSPETPETRQAQALGRTPGGRVDPGGGSVAKPRSTPQPATPFSPPVDTLRKPPRSPANETDTRTYWWSENRPASILIDFRVPANINTPRHWHLNIVDASPYATRTYAKSQKHSNTYVSYCFIK